LNKFTISRKVFIPYTSRYNVGSSPDFKIISESIAYVDC